MNLFQALENGYNLLKTNNINSYKIDAELLLSDSLNISKERLILNLKRVINNETYNNFLMKINRRRAKEPIAYILNKKEFWKNNLKKLVSKHYQETESNISKNILENFDLEVNNFLQVCPKEMIDKLENPITNKSIVGKAS